MICIICGKPTKYRYDTTAICWRCKPIYNERVALNELERYKRCHT